MINAEEFDAILVGIPMALVVVDASERIVALNDEAAKLFDRGVVGRHYVTALRQPDVLACVERAFSEGVNGNANYRLHREGQELSLAVTCAPVLDGEAVTAVLVSFEDETDRHRAAQVRRDFVANVSHELRTPLTAMLGFIETLRGAAKDDPEARDRFLSIMESEAERMNRLVGDLLSLNRVEGEERMRPKDSIDLVPILNSVIQLLRPVAKAAGVELVAEIAREELPIMGDADQLQQVFTNLVENAIKYGGSGGKVTVRATEHQNDPALRLDSIRISVIDEGEGIGGEHIARLTERFYRVDSHRSREQGGTGLGLAIVKHIVNRHRGRLLIDSTVGLGSTFTVVLPAGL